MSGVMFGMFGRDIDFSLVSLGVIMLKCYIVFLFRERRDHY
ncbi:hypothetical protein B425_1353 [Bacillus amyloliquefaciens]|nr:hypothetical protein B425_1353 [Bacillus amyloliquefaciens]